MPVLFQMGVSILIEQLTMVVEATRKPFNPVCHQRGNEASEGPAPVMAKKKTGGQAARVRCVGDEVRLQFSPSWVLHLSKILLRN